jgi:hypothetical protein
VAKADGADDVKGLALQRAVDVQRRGVTLACRIVQARHQALRHAAHRLESPPAQRANDP